MSNEEKIPLVVVAGPTASGKTEAAVRICQWFDGEAVSADSMQLYRYLSIGTAKPSKEEMEGIVHHLLDCVEPSQPYSVADYVGEARQIVAEIHRRGKLPVLVGGTGLYIDSLVQNIQFSPGEQDPVLRQRLRDLAEKEGNQALWQQLQQRDPEAAAAIHPNNVGRVIRALEILETEGHTKTQQAALSRQEPSPYEVFYIGINYRQRQTLYERIDRRVLLMLEQGLEEEARWLLGQGLAPTAAQAIGYKEMFGYLKGEESLEEAIRRIQTGSRHYAKRQLTWFRRNPDIHWFYPDDYPSRQDFLLALREALSSWGPLCYTEK